MYGRLRGVKKKAENQLPHLDFPRTIHVWLMSHANTPPLQTEPNMTDERDEVEVRLDCVEPLEEVSPNYCSAAYTLSLAIGEREFALRGWVRARWNRRGKWVVAKSDEQYEGTPAAFADGKKILIGDDLIAEEDAPAAAAAKAAAINRRIHRVVDPAIIAPPPSAEDVWDDLARDEVVRGLVRVGDWRGAGVVAAWQDPVHGATVRPWPDDDDIDRIVDVIAVATRDAIEAAVSRWREARD